MTTFAEINNAPAEDYQAFVTMPDTAFEDAVYDPAIEQASDNQLRSWILSQGQSPDDIDELIDAGQSLKQIAQDISDNSFYRYPA